MSTARKKQAQAMNPAQMSRPSLRYRMVAIPPSSPMLTDSATSCDIVMPPSLTEPDGTTRPLPGSLGAA